MNEKIGRIVIDTITKANEKRMFRRARNRHPRVNSRIGAGRAPSVARRPRPRREPDYYKPHARELARIARRVP